MFYFMSLVPSDILARGPEAVKAYNNALIDGKACIKRVPIMIIGQDRTGKTSLKRSLKGEKFNANETSTEGIETDPSHFNVSTEIWRAGKKDKKANSETNVLFEYHAAKLISESLTKRKPNSLAFEESSVAEQTTRFGRPMGRSNSSTEPSATESKVTERRTEKKNRQLIAANLPENLATRVKNLLDNGEKIEEEDKIYSILWDFGGQSVYYTTHPIFLTEKAIYILACDLSRNPHKKADTLVKKGLYKNEEDICCNKTNLDYLDFWMSSIYSLVGSDANGQDTTLFDTLPERLPPVFLVCTHADKPYCSTDPKKLALEIYGFLREKTHKKHLFKDVFVVDNTKSGSGNECPEVVRLREEVLAVAQQLPQMKEAIPLKWLKYENTLQLLRKERKKWIPISEARQIASDKCGIDHDEQFRTLLNFLHDQKVLIHFNETPELENMVILDPQWLIDVFKKVITVKQYKHTEHNVEELWLKLEKTGILDERLLDHEWKPLLDMYSEETCKSLIAIMERFSLLCAWPSDGANKQYLVPSMLRSPPTDEVTELLASVRIPSLFVRFESGRVPPGLFSRLVLHFYQWCNEEWKSQVNPDLFNNFALFHIRPDQSVIFLCHSSSIEIAFHDGSDSLEAVVACFPDGNFDLTTSRAIHWQLRMILECMRKEFGWLKNMKYKMCVCCPVCSQKGSVRCRTHDVRGCECLHLLSESELQQCPNCTRPSLRGNRRIRIKMFAPWFTFSGSQESKILTNQVSL